MDSDLAREMTIGPVKRRKVRKYQPRAAQACQMCRLKKVKCDQQQPCRTCVDREFDCVYDTRSENLAMDSELQTAAYMTAEHRIRTKSASLEGWHDNNLQSTHHHDDSLQNSPQDSSASASTSRVSRGSLRPNDGCSTLNSAGPSAQVHSETVEAVNHHTRGTEFYGKSSSFSLLNQLFIQARAQNLASSPATNPDPGPDQQPASPTTGAVVTPSPSLHSVLSANMSMNPRCDESGPKISDKSPLSVVNLLYDESSAIPESRPRSPLTVAGRGTKPRDNYEGDKSSDSPPRERLGSFDDPLSHSMRQVLGDPQPSTNTMTAESEKSQTSMAAKPGADPFMCFFGKPMQLEMEYLNLFFLNLHLMLPFLSPADFKRRCQAEIWGKRSWQRLRRDRMHFLALYNIVLAIGALTAGSDMLRDLRTELETQSRKESHGIKKGFSSLHLSRHYFQRSRRLLGNVFEVCSLESAQTLLLMSLYCQYALNPHASYMYSGMAVRTALAIGLPYDNNAQSPESKEIDSKTWWCIYIQETETSCCSGRLSSLLDCDEYGVPYPVLEHVHHPDHSVRDSAAILMTPLLCRLSAILQRATKEIYHARKQRSLRKKSEIACALERDLDRLASDLPSWLRPDLKDFRQPEWASKQGLSLQLRFQHARMFLHRPFVANCSHEANLDFVMHVQRCLDAARKTISILYDAYIHRYYFRTWWYNATHALYASIMILYLLLLNSGDLNLPVLELRTDVGNALKILEAMRPMEVACRYAELIKEILEIADTDARSRGRLFDSSRLSVAVEVPAVYSLSSGSQSDHQIYSTTRAELSRNEHTNATVNAPGSHEWPMPEWMGLTRDDLLANLMGPNVLEGFAMGTNDHTGMPSAFSHGNDEQNAISDLEWNFGFRFDSDYAEDGQGGGVVSGYWP